MNAVPADDAGRGPDRARPALTWTVPRGTTGRPVGTHWPVPVTRDLAWGGATGRGVRVCIVDSGVEPDHPDIGAIQGSYVVTTTDEGDRVVLPTDGGDAFGHGTACAGVVRTLAPECELYSVQVLSDTYSSSGDAFVTGLRWAARQGFDVVSVSLSTTRRKFAEALREIADEAYFHGTVLVASAHNTPVESFPWRFSSVISVGSHAERDPDLILYNPEPPVEFFAHGTDVEVPWIGGTRTRITGNSFATPHITGYCALALSKHPGLTPFQVKSLLYLISDNVRGPDDPEGMR